MTRLTDAVIYGVVIVVVFFAITAAMGNDSIKAMIAARGARALVLSRGTLTPVPVPPGPKPGPPGPKPGPSPGDPCCNECKGTGMWKPDTKVSVACPCDPSCPCKSKSGSVKCIDGKCSTKGRTK